MSATKAAASTGASQGHLRVTQVRSGISTKPKHRGTLRALGLRGVGRSRVLPDRPDVRGMLARVPHLVTVQPAAAQEAADQAARSDAARRARRASEGTVPVPQEAPAAPTRTRRREQGARMKLHDLRPPAGANRPKRRVGRGIAGKGGKTAGRGTKGTGARDNVKPGFEGGQLQLAQRVPKLKGFHNPFRVSYAVVNLDTLDSFDGDEATPATLQSRRSCPQRRPGQGARSGRAAPGRPGPGPRRVGLGSGRHRGRRWQRRDPAHALRARAPAGAGQHAHQPVASYSRVPLAARRRGVALELEEHLQGP